MNGKTVCWKDGTVTHVADVIAQIGGVLMLHGGLIVLHEDVTVFGFCSCCGKTQQIWTWKNSKPSVQCDLCS